MKSVLHTWIDSKLAMVLLALELRRRLEVRRGVAHGYQTSSFTGG
jgi:hypothetical protein